MRVPTLPARLAPRGAGTPHPGRGRFQPRGPSGKGARPVVVLSWSPVVERPHCGEGSPPSSAGRRQDETTTGQQVAPRPSSGKGAAGRRPENQKGRALAEPWDSSEFQGRRGNGTPMSGIPPLTLRGFEVLPMVPVLPVPVANDQGRRGDRTTRNRPPRPSGRGERTPVSSSSCRPARRRGSPGRLAPPCSGPARGGRTQSLRDAILGEGRSAPQEPLRGRAKPAFARAALVGRALRASRGARDARSCAAARSESSPLFRRDGVAKGAATRRRPRRRPAGSRRGARTRCRRCCRSRSASRSRRTEGARRSRSPDRRGREASGCR